MHVQFIHKFSKSVNFENDENLVVLFSRIICYYKINGVSYYVLCLALYVEDLILLPLNNSESYIL